MNWIELINGLTGRLSVGDTVIEARSWAYNSHLPDNVPHRHTYFEVCLVGDWGEGVYRVEGIAHPLKPGTLFFARPGVLHQIVNTAQPLMELYWVCFQWSPQTTKPGEIDALLDEFARSSLLTIPDHGGQLRTLWQSLRLTAESAPSPLPKRGAEFQLQALMSALLIAIARAGSKKSDLTLTGTLSATGDLTTTRIREAVRFVHDALYRSLSVAEVASAVGLSERQLTRLFVRFAGVPPALYITRARIDRAAVLLLKTDDPIKQIGSLVGFDDVHHFTRVFTRLIGCPPGQFRQQGGPPRPLHASPDNVGKLVW